MCRTELHTPVSPWLQNHHPLLPSPMSPAANTLSALQQHPHRTNHALRQPSNSLHCLRATKCNQPCLSRSLQGDHKAARMQSRPLSAPLARSPRAAAINWSIHKVTSRTLTGCRRSVQGVGQVVGALPGLTLGWCNWCSTALKPGPSQMCSAWHATKAPESQSAFARCSK